MRGCMVVSDARLWRARGVECWKQVGEASALAAAWEAVSPAPVHRGPCEEGRRAARDRLKVLVGRCHEAERAAGDSLDGNR